jgi:hypothetical protein
MSPSSRNTGSKTQKSFKGNDTSEINFRASNTSLKSGSVRKGVKEYKSPFNKAGKGVSSKKEKETYNAKIKRYQSPSDQLKDKKGGLESQREDSRNYLYEDEEEEEEEEENSRFDASRDGQHNEAGKHNEAGHNYGQTSQKQFKGFGKSSPEFSS